jgi:hypothetical protein
MPTIFVSHSAHARATAVEFKELVLDGSSDLKVFLSSDWDSIPSGTIWLQEIEHALATHTHFVALITQVADASLPWMCYEVGYARGRGLLPKIFVFGGFDSKEIALPIGGIHLVGTGDTNRWIEELTAMKVANVIGKQEKFAKLFRQNKAD